jgi:hypothetical protein
VITYVSVGFAPTDRYIEWRGAPTRNWANVSLNAQVIMGWYAHFRDPSPFGRIFRIGGGVGGCGTALPLRVAVGMNGLQFSGPSPIWPTGCPE